MFTWLMFRMWRRCCIWIFFMTLILWMENWLVSSVEEVFKSMKKVSSFYATAIIFATSTTSTHCSKLSGVLWVTHFSQGRGIWNDIWLLVMIVLDIFTQRMFTNWEKQFLKSWMNSISHIKLIKKIVQDFGNIRLWGHLCQRRLLQTNWDYNMDREACSYISFYLVKLDPRTIFLWNANPHHLISSFITALEGLATHSKTQMKLNFFELEAAIKIKLCAILEQLNQRRNQAERVSNFIDDCMVEEEEKDSSWQFLQMQKNQLIDLQDHFERYCNVLQVFGFNSAKYDLNLIKSYLLPILVNDRDIEPIVIKKAYQFVSFKIGDIQLLEIMNFLGGATSLGSFLKSYKTKETEGFFPYEWFDCPDKMNNKEFPPYDSFFSVLRNCNPPEKGYNDFQNLVNSGLTTEQAVVKLRMDRIPPTAAENYSFLQMVWENNNMQNFMDFLKWYNNKEVVPTLEAMQKMIEFYHNKGIDMLKLGCTLPNVVAIFVRINRQIQNFITLQSRMKVYWRRYEKIWLVVLLLSLHVKL